MRILTVSQPMSEWLSGNVLHSQRDFPIKSNRGNLCWKSLKACDANTDNIVDFVLFTKTSGKF